MTFVSQNFARAFGERLVAEAFREVIDWESKSPEDSVLIRIFRLHLLATVEKDLDWYLEAGLLTAAQAKQVSFLKLSLYSLIACMLIKSLCVFKIK